MRFRNGIEAHDTIRDSYGETGWLMWVEDSYFPRVFYVRGESCSDAHDWFVEDDRVLAHIKVDDTDMKAEFFTNNQPDYDKIVKAMDDGIIAVNDSGVCYWSESINGRQVHGPDRG